jgi:hypothetical protein
VLGTTPPEVHAFEKLAQEKNMDLKIVVHEDPAIQALYEAPLALIRPDHIVAWRGRDASDCAGILQTVLGWCLPAEV